MIKTKWKSDVFFVWQNVRWKIMYIVLNEGTFTFIKVVGCSCLNFKLWSFFPCCNYITLAQSFTAILIWWNKTLYTITDKDVDNNMFILRKFFRDFYVFLENTGHENANIDILKFCWMAIKTTNSKGNLRRHYILSMKNPLWTPNNKQCHLTTFRGVIRIEKHLR